MAFVSKKLRKRLKLSVHACYGFNLLASKERVNQKAREKQILAHFFVPSSFPISRSDNLSERTDGSFPIGEH